jgi:hypothetical protein
MRRLTVKDFITYAAPCLICGKPSSIGLGFVDTEYMTSPLISIRGSVGTNFTYFDLKSGYTNDIKLYIFHRDNKFLTNDKRRLEEYLASRKLSLGAYCPRMCSQFATHPLSFQLNSGQVAPVAMKWERLVMPVGEWDNYYLTSYFDENRSVLDSRIVGEIQSMEIPLLPRDSFRDRAHLIEKLQTYLLFS